VALQTSIALKKMAQRISASQRTEKQPENMREIRAYYVWLTVVSVEPKKMWIYAWQKTKRVNSHSHIHVRVCVHTYKSTPSFAGWTRSDEQ
jgi:hypothetical protein